MSSKFLIVIVGSTAVGKTSLSIELAKTLKTEIISADSRQVFREMSIGTAKPTQDEMKGIPHHFISSHSILENFNAGKFEQEAISLIGQLFKKHNILILVGGSGLYIDAVCKGFDELPESNSATREKLNALYIKNGISELQKLLKRYDPEYYEKVDVNNPHRLIRAIEVSMISGKPYSSFRKNAASKREFKIVKIGLNMEREKLYQQINLRVEEMMRNGFLNEVKQLYPLKNNSLNTVGYKELVNHIEGKYNLEEAIELIKKNTRNFAKRQLTWFRKDKEIKWFTPGQEKEIIDYINGRIEI